MLSPSWKTTLVLQIPASYMTDAYVYQLGRGAAEGKFSKKNSTGTSVTPLKSYKFVDIFPVNVSAIDLSYDSSDTIEEFTVEFAVQSFEAGSGDPKDQNGVASSTEVINRRDIV